VWSLGRGNDGVLLQGQFYSDGTRVVNCQYDRMSNHTKIHQEDVWLQMDRWNSLHNYVQSRSNRGQPDLAREILLKGIGGLPDLAREILLKGLGVCLT